MQSVELTPCDLAWMHLPLDTVVPPLKLDADAFAWAEAFSTRDAICHLLQGPLPQNMIYSGTAVLHSEMLKKVQQALDQGTEQRARLDDDGRPSGVDGKRTYLATFVGESRSRRPFGTVSPQIGAESERRADLIICCS